MKQLKIFALVLVVACVTSGMGLKQENKIPVPAKSFSAIITDRAGVVTETKNSSVEGNTFFRSQHGRGSLFIDFNSVKRIEFEESKSRMVPVTIKMKNGDSLDGLVSGNNFVYGFALFGKFKIKIREIKSIDFPDEPSAASPTEAGNS